MDQEIIDNYIKAGKIASRVREESKKLGLSPAFFD